MPIGLCVTPANRQDATYTGQVIDTLVLRPHQPDTPATQPVDFRSMPRLTGDGNFAKAPAIAAAAQRGFRLWAPRIKQSRKGLGRLRQGVERGHNFLNQFGRIARRWDRRERMYLMWGHLACAIIYIRAGFVT
jgi:transposase